MSVSEAMMADAILQYMNKSGTEFEASLLERSGIDLGSVSWRGDKANKRLVVKVTKLSQDGSVVSENEYALTVSRI